MELTLWSLILLGVLVLDRTHVGSAEEGESSFCGSSVILN